MTNDDVYIAGQVERALAQDERTHELGVHIHIDEGAVVLRGEVAGEQRQRLVAQVAAEAAPGMAVRNEVSVTEVLSPDRRAGT